MDPALLFFLLFYGVQVTSSNEVCATKCTEKFTSEQELSACKDGCRLAKVFNFVSGHEQDEAGAKCRDGCKKSYNDGMANEACAFGCNSEPPFTGGQVEVAFDSSDPVFNVASNAMRGMFSRMSNSFPHIASGPFDEARLSSEENSDEWFADPFAEMRRRMQLEMAKFHQIAQHLMNMGEKSNPLKMIAIGRPSGHDLISGVGPSVGNSAVDGSAIISVHPVEGLHLLGHPHEAPSQPQQEPGWWSRLAARARRLSSLSQWLVCAALLLCLVAMVSISVAILKQIKAQRYQNLQNIRVITPATFGAPLPAKKIPLGDEPVSNDYPLIHDSPPPAYDQLSVHKQESNEPKA